MARLAAALALAAACWPPWAAPAVALEDPESGRPVLLTADEMVHDRDLGVVTARGNVEISQRERVLRAATVTWNERTGTVTATGSVVLLEPTGEVIFAEHVELANELSDGFVRGMRMLLEDNSRIAAAGGRRSGPLTEARQGVFSPCNLCAEDPTRPPLWQIKALRVIHDREARDIVYRGAWMEIAGVPVAYTPYFRHPDPTVRRRSGFLTPSWGQSTDLGFMVRPAYFAVLDDDKDLTLDPLYTSNNGIVASGEYRQAFDTGMVRTRVSLTSDKRHDGSGNDRFRGHLDLHTGFDIDRTFRAGAAVRAATDDTYLRRYEILSDDVLHSDIHVEAFGGRDYADLRGSYFQSLRADDDQDTIPVAAPDIDWYHVPAGAVLGGRLRFDANVLALTREDGTDSRRVSLISSWQRAAIGRFGEAWRFGARLQTDAYGFTDARARDTGRLRDGVRGRLFPQALAQVRYPLMRPGRRTRQVLEPVAQLVLGPNGGNNDDIPNEDSLAIDLNDSNLFNPSRYPGRDRVEGGSRVDYALRGGMYGLDGGEAGFLVGQSYRLRADDALPGGTGLRGHFSDLVGRVGIATDRHVDAVFRTRFNKDTLRASRGEIEGSFGPPSFNLTVDYVFFDSDADLNFGGREEVNANLRSQLTRRWSLTGSYRRDLENSLSLSWGAGLAYEDECLSARIDFGRSFFQNRDIEPSDSVLFRFVFKHLGEFRQQVQ